jgi:hypothetical protein
MLVLLFIMLAGYQLYFGWLPPSTAGEIPSERNATWLKGLGEASRVTEFRTWSGCGFMYGLPTRSRLSCWILNWWSKQGTDIRVAGESARFGVSEAR